jgi:hypothetical protein
MDFTDNYTIFYKTNGLWDTQTFSLHRSDLLIEKSLEQAVLSIHQGPVEFLTSILGLGYRK